MRRRVTRRNEPPTLPLPTIEVSTRRERIDPAPLSAHDALARRRVLLAILQHVHERSPRLGRRADVSRVISIREHATGSTEDPVESPRDTHLEALHRTAERDFVLHLHEQVEMVLLHREVDDSHAQAFLGDAERVAHDPIGARAAQVRHARHDAAGDVDRVARVQRSAPRVRNLGGRSLGLATGSGALAAPRTRQHQCELTRPSCLRHRPQVGPTRPRSRTRSSTRNGGHRAAG